MSSDIPDEQTLQSASELTIYDSKGEEVKFGSLFEDSKTVVVFIRHFFCGACQGYVSKLAEIPQSALDAANVKLTVVGCGEWVAIETYSELSKFSGPIFADPSRKLYHVLGMAESLSRTPAGQERRSYLSNPISTAIKGAWKALQHASLIGKQGNISQNGGEFIFGPGKTCTFASRMQHSEDHVEVNMLMEAARVNM
ncbi:hypothetical protein APHAL10511_005430 [Amanita phalloides]|nr:hypothetical protein APHAL10511_005430 [Amanita phalloides]